MTRPLTIVRSVQSPMDVVVDQITGGAREQLVGEPAPVIYARLYAELRGIGLTPNEAKVRRIAAWINATPAATTTLDAA